MSNLPLSLTYTWYVVWEPREHLQGRFLNAGLFSSSSRILVARWMQRRHDEWTAAISTRALKESLGPWYFHLTTTANIIQNPQNARDNHEPVILDRYKTSNQYLNDWLNASGFSARRFIVLATESISSISFICSNDPGQGAKSWILGAPTTTGIVPTAIGTVSSYIMTTYRTQITTSIIYPYHFLVFDIELQNLGRKSSSKQPQNLRSINQHITNGPIAYRTRLQMLFK